MVSRACKCSSLQLSKECFVDGHVAAGFEMLEALHPDLCYLGQGSVSSTLSSLLMRLRDLTSRLR